MGPEGRSEPQGAGPAPTGGAPVEREASSAAPAPLAAAPRRPLYAPDAPRPRGLDAPPPPGGADPDIDETLRAERRPMRMLVLMVALIVGVSLLLTILAALMPRAVGS